MFNLSPYEIVINKLGFMELSRIYVSLCGPQEIPGGPR